MNVLEIQNLKKRFGDKEVLRGVSFEVPKGSVFGFIGRNGAGKTTTMKTVLGLLQSDSGTVNVMGEAVRYGQTSTNRYIGYLPDVPEFYAFMTAPEYLCFCGKLTGIPSKDLRARCGEVLEQVGLSGERHRIKGFSRGMKQRLGIAQALLNRPRLLICDEPTSALDVVSEDKMYKSVMENAGEETILFISHRLASARFCDRILVFDSGEITETGSHGELLSRKGCYYEMWNVQAEKFSGRGAYEEM